MGKSSPLRDRDRCQEIAALLMFVALLVIVAMFGCGSAGSGEASADVQLPQDILKSREVGAVTIDHEGRRYHVVIVGNRSGSSVSTHAFDVTDK